MPRLTRLSFPIPLLRELLDRVTADDTDIRLSEPDVQRLVEKTKTSWLEKQELRALLGAMVAERETDNIERYIELREACVRAWYGPELYETALEIERSDHELQSSRMRPPNN